MMISKALKSQPVVQKAGNHHRHGYFALAHGRTQPAGDPPEHDKNEKKRVAPDDGYVPAERPGRQRQNGEAQRHTQRETVAGQGKRWKPLNSSRPDLNFNGYQYA